MAESCILDDDDWKGDLPAVSYEPESCRHFVLRTLPALRTANALRTEYQYTGLRTGDLNGVGGGALASLAFSALRVTGTRRCVRSSPYAVRSQYAAPETSEVRSAQ